MGHRARREGQAAAGQLLMDLSGRAVLGVTQSAGQVQDVEAELVVRQGEVSFRLGAVRAQVEGAG